MRLGEILLAAGVIDAEQLEAALRQQVVYGGRLGTNVIELGFADADQIARALASQHTVPAALRRHLERHDPAVLRLVPRELATEAFAVPVAFSLTGGVRRLVLCMRDPADRAAVLAIGKQADLEIVPCVAPELLVYALLERFYNMPRPRRMAMAGHGQTTPLPMERSGEHALPVDDGSVEIDFDADDSIEMPAALQLVDLDDDGVVKDLEQFGHGSTRRGRVAEIAGSIWASASALEGVQIAGAATSGISDMLAAASATTSVAADLSEIPAEPAVADTDGDGIPDHEEPGISLDEAREQMAVATSRDEVDRAVLDFMRGSFGGGLVLLARDELALGIAGFGGHFDDTSVQSVVIPLTVPSAFRRARDLHVPFVGAPPAEGTEIQDRFFKLFPVGVPAEIIVAPVTIVNRVVCLYYGHGVRGGELSNEACSGLSALAIDAGNAFVRLIKSAKRN